MTETAPRHPKTVAPGIQRQAGDRVQSGPLQALADISHVSSRLAALQHAADAGPPPVQRRSKNPYRQEEGAYDQPSPVDMGTIPLTEHHLVPHARLEKVKKILGLAATEAIAPTWGEVTVRVMMNLQSGWKEEWITGAKIDPNAKAADSIDTLADWIDESSGLEEGLKRRTIRGIRAAPESFKGGEDFDVQWGGAFFEWMPGNILLGPTARPHDQGSGDDLDKEAVFVLRKLGQEDHARAAEAADAHAIVLVAADKDATKEQKDEMIRLLTVLNGFGYTPYDQAQRALWEVYKDGFQAIGYTGN